MLNSLHSKTQNVHKVILRKIFLSSHLPAAHFPSLETTAMIYFFRNILYINVSFHSESLRFYRVTTENLAHFFSRCISRESFLHRTFSKTILPSFDGTIKDKQQLFMFTYFKVVMLSQECVWQPHEGVVPRT